jgi:hypothetical protein
MDVTDLRRVAREGENLWTIRSSGSRRGMCMELDTEKSIDLKAEQQQEEALARAKLKRRFERVHIITCLMLQSITPAAGLDA